MMKSAEQLINVPMREAVYLARYDYILVLLMKFLFILFYRYLIYGESKKPHYQQSVHVLVLHRRN